MYTEFAFDANRKAVLISNCTMACGLLGVSAVNAGVRLLAYSIIGYEGGP